MRRDFAMYPADDTEVQIGLLLRELRELRERLAREVEWSRALREMARELTRATPRTRKAR